VDTADAWLVNMVGVADTGSLGVDESLVDEDEDEGMVRVRERRFGVGRFSEGTGMKLEGEAESSLVSWGSIAVEEVPVVADEATDELEGGSSVGAGSGWSSRSGDMVTSGC